MKSNVAQWEAVVDGASGSTYFWNPDTGETRWDDPQAAASMMTVHNPIASMNTERADADADTVGDRRR